MPIDPATAVYNLMQADPNIIAVAVLKGKDIIYSTDNWDISGDELVWTECTIRNGFLS